MQETLLRAWTNQDKFASGSNLAAWLVVILRNAHISLIRKRHREQVGLNEGWEDSVTTAANQEDHVALTEVLTALDSLSACDHDILRSILVDCSSHRELALRHDCALGTIRSRLSRARGRLAQMLL